MDVFKILTESGKVETVPAAQFPLNDKQQALVIGVDFSIQDCRVKSGPGIDAEMAGRLTGLEAGLKRQVMDGLLQYRWDFIKWPDPSIILMTDNRINPQLN